MIDVRSNYDSKLINENTFTFEFSDSKIYLDASDF